MYPGVWDDYAQFLADREALGGWPAWCYCPMSAALAIASRGGTPTMRDANSVGAIAALAAWRPTQGLYRFDPTLFEELVSTPVTGEIPADQLQRLPEWCVYVEIPGAALADRTRMPVHNFLGFFAHLEFDANDHRAELRLLLDHAYHAIPLSVHLGGTLEEGLALMFEEARKRGYYRPNAETKAADIVGPLLSVLLYLCAGDSESRPTRDPKRKHGNEGQQVKRAKNGRLHLPPARPEVWETGFRLGAALRAARARAAEPGASPRGHVRKAHWHTFLMGPQDAEARTRDVRWLPPIPVNLDEHTEPTTIRHVTR